MLVVALTGGIASGKTTISNLFAHLGIPIIDTDVISRQLLEQGKPGYLRVIEKLGQNILLANGDIDRSRLRRLVFNNPELKGWLESILHPLIRQEARQQVKQQRDTPYVMLVVPLLFESKFTDLADRILVVDCSRETQLRRLVARDHIDEALANAMLDQQSSNEERLTMADDIIVNNDDRNLEQQVANLHRGYLKMATLADP